MVGSACNIRSHLRHDQDGPRVEPPGASQGELGPRMPLTRTQQSHTFTQTARKNEISFNQGSIFVSQIDIDDDKETDKQNVEDDLDEDDVDEDDVDEDDVDEDDIDEDDIHEDDVKDNDNDEDDIGVNSFDKDDINGDIKEDGNNLDEEEGENRCKIRFYVDIDKVGVEVCYQIFKTSAEICCIE